MSVGGEGGAADYADAFAALNEEEDVGIVVCDSASAEVHQSLKENVERASGARRERIAVVGGVFSVPKSTQGQQIPGRLVMANSQLVVPNPAGLIKYTATGAPSGTTVSADGKVTAGATTGDFDVTMEYPADGTAEYTNTVSVSIV